MMKVMYLADAFENPYAGTEGQLSMLIEGVDKSLIEPHMTLFRHSSYIEKNGFPCAVQVLNIRSIARLSSILKLWRFSRELRSSGFSVVHIFFNDASIIAPLFLKMAGLKVIISRRDMGYWYTAPILFALRFSRFFVDSVIVNSLAVQQVTSKLEYYPFEKVHVIYNGYENVDVLDDLGVDDEFSRNVPAGAKIIGLVANIRPIKRISDIIKAMPIVKRSIPDAFFVLVGGGDNNELRELAQQLGVSDSIWFAGRQEKSRLFMRHFDVAALVSESEGFSNSIIEYMKEKCPVVCTRVGGNEEIVVEGETGYLVDVGDISVLADRIVNLLDDPQRAKRFGEYGYNLVQEKYGKEKMLMQHVSLYEELSK